ncbi:hypothetical protein ES703_52207 [subsurface metagenome]
MGAAVDQVIIPVYQPLVVEVNKNALHCAGKSFIQSKPFPRPVQRGAELLQLVNDDAAVFVLPIPGDLQKLFTSDLLPGFSFFSQTLLDHIMDRYAGVVCPGKPESVVSLHPPPANDDIGKSKAESMAHMQGACDIGRGKDH